MNIPAKKLHLSRISSSLILLVLIGQTLMLTGCSTTGALMAKQVRQQTGNQEIIHNVMDALQATETRYAKAQAEDVDTYAPAQMDRAARALTEARQYAERFQDNPALVDQSVSLFLGDTMGQHVLSLITKANNALGEAEDNKKQADAIFVKVNENFTWLDKFEARTYFRDAYQDLRDARQQLVADVARGDMDAAQQGLPQLLSEQAALEIVAAQRFYLGDLSRRVDREGHNNLTRYAPISYSSVVGALNKAKAVVAQNPRDESRILAARQKADFSLSVADAVAGDMQKLANMNAREMERWLILLTGKLNKVGLAVGSGDVRDHGVMQQLDLMAKAVDNTGKTGESTKHVAAVTPEKNASQVADKDKAADVADVNIADRMTRLEQSISEKIKALSDQINAMKKVNVSAKANPGVDVPSGN